MNKLAIKRQWPPQQARVLLVWLVLVSVSIATLAVFQRNMYLSELNAESAQLFRIASQRAVQHEAHTTALAVAIDSGIDQHQDIFRRLPTPLIIFSRGSTRFSLSICKVIDN